MSQNQQISDSLDTCQQYINQFLKKAYALDLDQLSANDQLKVLAFYEEMLALLHTNYDLFNGDR
ncbi:hypothetical protein [Pedobacter foliorum]|uniref:hypothetical protein n=1 Tax=Pedobacter foliorum TaxID=2739058 RepID=UPI001564C477|nr:hypothetical protein [Pedobacter foliorum]NRF39328.1 hypothetical protein [Pedobacter foliorum]